MTETIKDIRERVRKAQEYYGKNIETIEEILKEGRGYVSRAPKNEDVIALMSGGLDSSIMVHKIIESYNCKIHPLFFKRGARAERWEEQAFDFFIDFYNRRFPENIKEPLKLEYNIPPKELKEYFPKNLTLTIGHPLRNSTLQNLAVMYAVSLNGKHDLNIKTILTGSTEDDEPEPEQSRLSLRAQTLSTCIQTGDWSWNVTSPFIDQALTEEPVHKSDLIQYALQKFIPLEKTRTCFSSKEVADRICFACVKRLRAFDYLGIKDTLKYEQGRKEKWKS